MFDPLHVGRSVFFVILFPIARAVDHLDLSIRDEEGIAYASGTLPFSIWNLKGYFDTIPHANLLKLVARRVVDRGVGQGEQGVEDVLWQHPGDASQRSGAAKLRRAVEVPVAVQEQ